MRINIKKLGFNSSVLVGGGGIKYNAEGWDGVPNSSSRKLPIFLLELQILVESQGGKWDEASSPAQKQAFTSNDIAPTNSRQQNQSRPNVGHDKNDDFYSDFDDLPSGMARSNTVDGGFDSYQNSG